MPSIPYIGGIIPYKCAFIIIHPSLTRHLAWNAGQKHQMKRCNYGIWDRGGQGSGGGVGDQPRTRNFSATDFSSCFLELVLVFSRFPWEGDPLNISRLVGHPCVLFPFGKCLDFGSTSGAQVAARQEELSPVGLSRFTCT